MSPGAVTHLAFTYALGALSWIEACPLFDVYSAEVPLLQKHEATRKRTEMEA
jgi:hypothetical protein